jgi:hypothetical protein
MVQNIQFKEPSIEGDDIAGEEKRKQEIKAAEAKKQAAESY